MFSVLISVYLASLRPHQMVWALVTRWTTYRLIRVGGSAGFWVGEIFAASPWLARYCTSALDTNRCRLLDNQLDFLGVSGVDPTVGLDSDVRWIDWHLMSPPPLDPSWKIGRVPRRVLRQWKPWITSYFGCLKLATVNLLWCDQTCQIDGMVAHLGYAMKQMEIPMTLDPGLLFSSFCKSGGLN